jgi:hypothetical protein
MKRLTGGLGGPAVLLLLAACGAAAGIPDMPVTGTVTGRFVREGGPLGPGGQQPAEHALRGTVTFTAAGHQPVTVRVGGSGAFSVRLVPGSYHVYGRTPEIVEVGSGGASRDGTCSLPQTVRVTGQHTLKIAVACIVP